MRISLLFLILLVLLSLLVFTLRWSLGLLEILIIILAAIFVAFSIKRDKEHPA